MKKRKPEQATEHERTAWRLRQQGYTQEEIADRLGLHQTSISRLLGRLNDRALRANIDRVERVKIDQTQILWHVLSESMRAWEASKEPLTRVKEGADGERITEVVKREGNTSYLATAFKAMADIRSIWGLDVAPAGQDSAVGVAEMLAKLTARAIEYEAKAAAAEQHPRAPEAAPAPAAPEVPDGPGTVQ